MKFVHGLANHLYWNFQCPPMQVEEFSWEYQSHVMIAGFQEPRCGNSYFAQQ